MRRSSLKYKFLIKITLTLAVVFSVMMAISYWLFWSAVTDAVREKGEALSYPIRERTASTLSLSGDIAGLEALSMDLQGLVGGIDRIEYARIIKADGTVVASHVLSEIGKQIKPAGTLDLKAATLHRSSDSLDVYTPLTAELYAQIGFNGERFTQKGMRTALLIALVALSALAFIYLLINHWVQDNIERPLERLGREAARVADGDLTTGFTEDDIDSDELSRLNRAFSGMAGGVRSIVLQIGEVSAGVSTRMLQLESENRYLTEALTLQNASVKTSIKSLETIDRNTGEINGRVEELFLISQETSSSILEIGGSIEEVEQHVSKLSGAVNETSSSITEIGRSISEVAGRSQDLAQNADAMSQAITDITSTVASVEKNVLQSTELAKEVSISAREGLDAVEKSSGGMERIKGTVLETTEVMQALGARSEQINEIVTVINQVTEKTNLLALNAAIIAAAAGEHGASFAVVADGIRDLARQVAAKTREIEELVQGVQKETRKAKEKVDAGLASVVEGEQLSEAARQKLHQIYDTSLRSEEMSKHISSAMAEQNRNSRALAEASGRIAAISHQIAMATQQEATASGQIQRSIAQMEELARSVLRTTHEQGEGSRRIAEATTRITSAIQAISEITSRHKSESAAILSSIHENQSFLTDSETRLDSLGDHIRSVNAAVADLQEEVRRFKVQ